MPDLDETGTIRSALMRRFRWYYFGDTDLSIKRDIPDILSRNEKQRLVGSSIKKPSVTLSDLSGISANPIIVRRFHLCLKWLSFLTLSDLSGIKSRMVTI